MNLKLPSPDVEIKHRLIVNVYSSKKSKMKM